MANEQNLKPVRSTEEARTRGSKGGKASVASRRRRKALREYMNQLLNLPVSTPEDFNAVSQLGVPVEDTDNAMLLTVALFQKAKAGDVAAFKEIRDLIGEDGEQDNGQLAELIRGLKQDDI